MIEKNPLCICGVARKYTDHQNIPMTFCFKKYRVLKNLHILMIDKKSYHRMCLGINRLILRTS